MNREINGHTKVCGIMGYPVEHTLSPLIHNQLAGMLDVDLVYVPFCVKPEDVAACVKGAWGLGIAGMNVTVPHKQAVMEAAVRVDPGACAIGAVNTLVAEKDGYCGYNTDWIGFGRALENAGITVAGRNVVIIGAGGAARSVLYFCAGKGAANICVLNRSRDRAQALIEDMGKLFPQCPMTALALEDWAQMPGDGWIAVQTTSVGMAPGEPAAPVEDYGFYDKLTCAMDIIYTPARTRFMELCQNAGVKAAGGLDMLLYQGVASFELWTGKKVPEEAAIKVKERLCEALFRDGK